MASKPSSLPRWADVGGGAGITDPPGGKKDTGWNVAEKPPAQYWNWYQNLVYQWMQYLDDLYNQAITWTAAHTFQALVTVQKGLVATQANVNGVALIGTGNGLGAGMSGTGGATAGAAGGLGTGGAGGGPGFQGTGIGSYAGLIGIGGASNGPGVTGTGGATNGNGGNFTGTGNGYGVNAVTGASGNGAVHADGLSGQAIVAVANSGTHAVETTQSGAGNAIKGSATTGAGVVGSASGASGQGVQGTSSHGNGVYGENLTGDAASIYAVMQISGTVHALRADALAQNNISLFGKSNVVNNAGPTLYLLQHVTGNRGHINLNQINPNTAGANTQDGDIWYTGSALKINIGGVIKTVTVT